MHKMHTDNFAPYERKRIKAPPKPTEERVQASFAPDKSPWKSKAKISEFASRNKWTSRQILDLKNTASSDSFNMKEQRKLMKHWYGARYTFVIDYMFAGKWGYLVAININTRKAFWILPSKIKQDGDKYIVEKHLNENAAGAIESLKKLMEQTPVKHLLSDQEKAFMANEFQTFCKRNGITHRAYVKNHFEKLIETNEKSRGNHSHTSLVDRLIRTLRMMAYNLVQRSEIDPKLMEYIVDEYNSSPHSTLSKYLGRPTTPNEVDSNLELENKIVLKIIAENLVISSAQYLPLGSEVRVYNDAHAWDKVKNKLLPGTFEVVGKEGGLVELKQGDNRIKVNRWMIKSA